MQLTAVRAFANFHAHNQFYSMYVCTPCMHEVFSMPAVHACMKFQHACMYLCQFACMHSLEGIACFILPFAYCLNKHFWSPVHILLYAQFVFPYICLYKQAVYKMERGGRGQGLDLSVSFYPSRVTANIAFPVYF